MKIKIRFYVGYYDGPLSGLLEIDDEPYWFNMIDEEFTKNDDDDYDRERIFEVLEIPPEVVEEEWKIHRDFERMVGTHHCQEHWCGTPRGEVRVGWRDEFWNKYPIGGRDDVRESGGRYMTITESELSDAAWRQP